MSNNTTISVVIPAYNCEKTIAKCIQAALNQDYPGQKELIVVDDGSTDNTPKTIQEMFNVKYLRQDNAGPATARNRGFAESVGEFIFFTDSDCVPTNNWISCVMQHFSDAGIGVVAGSYGIMNWESLLARCIFKEIQFRHQKNMPKHPKSFGSYNFCVRRNVFKQVGGFTPQYRHASGEDNDLSYKILQTGHRICFERSSIVKHYFTEQLLQYLKEQFRHGFWRVKMYFDHPLMSFGDDYTFWKDIVEPPLVLGWMLCLSKANFGASFYAGYANTLLLILLILEVFYAAIFTKHHREAIYFGFVMFLRAFVRTAGFMCGILTFFVKKPFKKVK